MNKVKRYNLFRTVAGCMAVALCAGVFAACGSGSVPQSQPQGAAASSQAPSADNAAAAQGYQLPIVTEPTTLTVMCPENNSTVAPTYGSGKLVVWNKIEEITGVTIEWECTLSADFENALNVRMASGSDLPDLVTIPDPIPYLKQEMLLPIDGLIAQYAPDIQRVFDENKDIKASISAPDGTIYSVPTIPKFINQIHTRALFIRKDWLDKVGMAVPTTMDEWYATLTAFKTTDLDGDGDSSNEIPYAHNSTSDLSGQREFSAAFGLELPYAAGYNVKDGKVFYDYATENAKAFITTMNKFYSEGLMGVMDSKTARSGLSTNMVGSMGDMPDQVTSLKNILETGYPEAEMVPAPFPSSEFGPGRSVAPYPVYNWASSLFITSACENPEAAIQWINFLYSDEGGKLVNFGIEGEHYTMENGKVALGDWYLNNPKGYGPGDAQRELGCRPNISNISSREFEEQIKAIDPMAAASIPLIESASRSPSFPQIMALDEELSVLRTAGADFETFVQENVAKFVLGERPMSEYDAFIAEMEGLGLSEILEVKQAQYDRYMAAMNA